MGLARPSTDWNRAANDQLVGLDRCAAEEDPSTEPATGLATTDSAASFFRSWHCALAAFLTNFRAGLSDPSVMRIGDRTWTCL